MGNETTSWKCMGCGRDISDIIEKENENKRLPCPDCGSTQRKMFVTMEVKAKASASMSVKVKDSSGFVKQESKMRESHSDKTNRPVKISVDVDRTDPDITKVNHKVEEVDEHGILYRKIHEDTKINKAKHRPLKKDDDN
jgi:DNA-directed RNA polymerase subunit RPC12/RpoP